MNSYDLSRAWWDFAFENPDKIKPIHTAIYFFAIEHCNRLGWKEKFGLPSQMVMEAIGVKNWKTYSQGLKELIDFGFIKIIEKSTNQYSSNIVAIVNFTKAHTKAQSKALDKALLKHGTKQGQSTVSINKQETINKETKNNKQELDFSFVNEKVIDDFKAFVEHRKAIKHPIKTQDQLERLYANLKKLSNSKAEIASEILNNSIVNGWQGIFELKKTQETKEEVDMYGKPRPSNQHVLLNGKWFVH